MAGGTHVFDMIKKLRENKNLKEKGYFKTKNSATKKSKSIDNSYKTATEEEKQKIRNEILKENELESKRSAKILAISIIVAVILVCTIYLYLNFLTS